MGGWMMDGYPHSAPLDPAASPHPLPRSGVLLYTMLVGRYPFPRPVNADGVGQMMRLMAAREYPLPASLGLSDACAKLLRRLLEPDAGARITLDGVMQVRGAGRWWLAPPRPAGAPARGGARGGPGGVVADGSTPTPAPHPIPSCLVTCYLIHPHKIKRLTPWLRPPLPAPRRTPGSKATCPRAPWT